MFSVVGASGESYLVEDQPFNTSGGQSDLFRCRDALGRVRVYKRYRAPVTETEPMVWVGDIARVGREIVTAAERTNTMAETAPSSLNWPIDVIRDGAGVLGVVLPFIPPQFLQADGRPLTFDYLCLASAYPPAAAFRVGVLIRACDIFKVLERDGLIHGDVSAKNVVWRRDQPHAYLIDCDGMRPTGSHARRGVGTEGWKDPRWIDGRITAHDQYSDRFALAVLMYRGLLLNPGAPTLVQGQWIKPSGIPADLDPRLRELFGRAFDDPFVTDTRPTAGEWLDVLKTVVLTADGAAYHPDALAVFDRHAQQFRDETASVAVAPPVPPPPLPPPALVPALPPQRVNRGVVFAVAATVLFAVVLIGLVALSLRGGDAQPAAKPAATTTSAAAATTTGPPPVRVGQCATVTAEHDITGVQDDCDSGATSYQVTTVAAGNAITCASPNDNQGTYAGYRVCLHPDLAYHHCYRVPPDDTAGWITIPEACGTPGTVTITGVEPNSTGADHDAFCHHNAYWIFQDPPTLYCVDLYK